MSTSDIQDLLNQAKALRQQYDSSPQLINVAQAKGDTAQVTVLVTRQAAFPAQIISTLQTAATAVQAAITALPAYPLQANDLARIASVISVYATAYANVGTNPQDSLASVDSYTPILTAVLQRLKPSEISKGANA